MQCGPSGTCRQQLAPAYPSDSPPPPGLGLDPTIIHVCQFPYCMEAAGGTGMRGGFSPIPARWRDAISAVSPKSASACLCLAHWAGAGRAVSASVLCSRARNSCWLMGAPGVHPRAMAHTEQVWQRAHCMRTQRMRLQNRPKFLARLAYTSYMIIACTEKLELKFPHMVLVDSFSSGFGEPFLPPLT